MTTDTGAETEGGDARGIAAAYAEAVLKDPGASDDAIELALLQAGYASDDVRRAIQVAPLALGRYLLAGLGLRLPETMLVLDASGRVLREGKLAEDEVFVSTAQLARTRNALIPAIGPRSSEFDAVNKALKRGSRPEDLIFAPVIVFLEYPTPDGMRAAQRLLRQRLEEQGPAADPPGPIRRPGPGRKPWWRWW